MTMQISLIGGGLVGSLLSIILARKGYTVDVFESRTDMRKTDISAGRSIKCFMHQFYWKITKRC